jgi:hypothetical protein
VKGTYGNFHFRLIGEIKKVNFREIAPPGFVLRSFSEGGPPQMGRRKPGIRKNPPVLGDLGGILMEEN